MTLILTSRFLAKIASELTIPDVSMLTAALLLLKDRHGKPEWQLFMTAHYKGVKVKFWLTIGSVPGVLLLNLVGDSVAKLGVGAPPELLERLLARALPDTPLDYHDGLFRCEVPGLIRAGVAGGAIVIETEEV